MVSNTLFRSWPGPAVSLVSVAADAQTTASTPLFASADFKDAQGNVVGRAVHADNGAVNIHVTLTGFTAADLCSMALILTRWGAAPRRSPLPASTSTRPVPNAACSARKAGTRATCPTAWCRLLGTLRMKRSPAASPFDKDGSSLVIHAQPDVHRSDPVVAPAGAS